ncbi:MAG TPA: CDP-glucose 4,6-dehydratase [Aestuariivirga sp.]|nr:CDP-glucose 4,6-dehydratase [Aestuariivirga sp.]
MSELLQQAFRDQRVLVTGHTGFKGSWLSLWLARLGAQVSGYALAPPTTPAMFEVCRVAEVMDHALGDVRDRASLSRRITEVRPRVIFHLAAQPLVRQSYVDPLETLQTNVMGTAHVLEAVREAKLACAIVVVTSDKCYDNREWVWGYRENDPMGGKDPYSMSKGATELVTASWRESFFPPSGPVKLASARAGNVIGGGDWAADRIIPDCVRAFAQGTAVELRSPRATRPWQHVLEPVLGYLMLAQRLLSAQGEHYCSGWNFGPAPADVRPVEQVVALMAQGWGPACRWHTAQAASFKEAFSLSLSCDKAAQLLGWTPAWTLEQAIAQTARWYRAWHDGTEDMRVVTEGQIDAFQAQHPSLRPLATA